MRDSEDLRWGSIDLHYTTKTSKEEKLKIFSGTKSGERKMIRYAKRIIENGGEIIDIEYD